MHYYLGNVFAILFEYPNATLLSVSRLFADASFREKIPAVGEGSDRPSLWQKEFPAFRDYMREGAAAVLELLFPAAASGTGIRCSCGRER
jgi:hypothetical protein